MSESYTLRVGGHTVMVRLNADDESKAVALLGNCRVYAESWSSDAILAAAEAVVGEYEAARQAKIDREQAVNEAQRQARAKARGLVPAVAE